MLSSKKNHPQFPSPTIIEAIIELHFDNPLSIKDIERISIFYKKNHETRKDNLLIYNTTVSPSGIAVSQEKSEQIRLQIQKSDSLVVRIFSDKFSVHWLGKYQGWKSLEKEFLKVLKEIKKHFPHIQSKKYGVRYINRLNNKSVDQPLKTWLKKCPHLPTNLLKSKSDFFYRGKWNLNESDKRFQIMITIAEDEQRNKNLRPLLYDIDVINTHAFSSNNNKEILKTFLSLHDMIWKIFSSSITRNYVNLMKKQEEN